MRLTLPRFFSYVQLQVRNPSTGVPTLRNQQPFASCSSVNGTHLCEHSTLLNDILKTELNFQGFVVSESIPLFPQHAFILLER